MSREIKFRCWNGEQMISPDYINRDGSAFWKENSMPTMSKEVMQFTGMVDKNGIDIYEGDIVRIFDNLDNAGIYQIMWRQECYCFVGDGGPGEWLMLEEFEGCEIVGNIHQQDHLNINRDDIS